MYDVEWETRHKYEMAPKYGISPAIGFRVICTRWESNFIGGLI